MWKQYSFLTTESFLPPLSISKRTFKQVFYVHECFSVYRMCALRPEEGTRFPGNGVTNVLCDDFELMIPLLPECWDHRSMSLHSVLCSTRSGTQGSMHTAQELNQLSCIPSSFALSFNSESLEEELHYI